MATHQHEDYYPSIKPTPLNNQWLMHVMHHGILSWSTNILSETLTHINFDLRSSFVDNLNIDVQCTTCQQITRPCDRISSLYFAVIFMSNGSLLLLFLLLGFVVCWRLYVRVWIHCDVNIFRRFVLLSQVVV